ncbi:L-threonylcarbamoyladenylate synthase [Breznakiellaceae bacterium SP9]
MIEYLVPTNIDDRVIARNVQRLDHGGLLALPTDTSWVIACSFKSKEGIKRLRKLSGERDEQLFTLLCSDISQFGEFCSLDNTRFRLVKRLSPGPYVFILKPLLGAEKTLGLRRPELGVRIPNDRVPLALIKAAQSPLYSITAKQSMLHTNSDEDALLSKEEELFESGPELEGIPGIECILDDKEERQRVFSTILDLSGDEITVLREGSGPWPI